MSKATERLRALLDERGVEWRYHINDDKTRTWFNVGKLAWFAYETPQGYLVLDCSPMTPEQVIEATLGRGTCHLTSAPQYGEGCQECSACGEVLDGYLFDEGRCPNCGAKVVKE